MCGKTVTSSDGRRRRQPVSCVRGNENANGNENAAARETKTAGVRDLGGQSEDDEGQTPLTSLTDTDQTVSVQPSYVRGRRAVRYMPARKPEPWFRLWATVCDICFPHHFPPAAHSHWHASDIGFLRRDSRSANVAVVFSRSFIMAISVLGRPLATWILYR